MALNEHLESTVKAHDQQLHRRVDLLLRTGKLLVESLADTNRIVRNMKRTAAYLGIPEEKLHINVSFTMLMVNVSDGDYSFTKFQRIEGHGVNMTAISEVSKLSWRAIEEDYSLDRYEEELEKIKTFVVKTDGGFLRANDVVRVDNYIVREWNIADVKSTFPVEIETQDGSLYEYKCQAGAKFADRAGLTPAMMKKMGLVEGDTISIRPLN